MRNLIKILLTGILLLGANIRGQDTPLDSVDHYSDYREGLSDMVVVMFNIIGTSGIDSIRSDAKIDIETPGVKEMISYVDSVVNPMRPLSQKDVVTSLERASSVLEQIIRSNKRPREVAEIAALEKISGLVLKAYSSGSGSNYRSGEGIREYTTWEKVFVIYVLIIGALLLGLVLFLRFEMLKNLRKVVAFIAVSSGVVEQGRNNLVERIK